MKINCRITDTVNGIDEAMQRMSLINIDDFEIFRVQKGIPVMIYNNSIKYLDGSNIENDGFNDKFRWLLSRADSARVVLFARFISKRKISYRRDDVKEALMALETSNTFGKQYLEHFALTVYDIAYIEQVKIPYSTRKTIIESMCKSAYTSDVNSETSIFLAGDNFADKKNQLVEYMVESARAGFDTAIFHKKSTSQDLGFSVICDPYKVYEATVVDASFASLTTSKEIIDVMKWLKVENLDGTNLMVPYIGLPDNRRSYMLDIYKKGLIRTLKFKAMKYSGKYNFATPL